MDKFVIFMFVVLFIIEVALAQGMPQMPGMPGMPGMGSGGDGEKLLTKSFLTTSTT